MKNYSSYSVPEIPKMIVCMSALRRILMKEYCVLTELHAFFISNTFISNARLKLAKDQANIKQHLKAELLLFENYSHSSSTLSFENNRTCSKR